MAKITSKYQVTIPKKIVDKYNIGPGDHIEWLEAGEAILVVPASKRSIIDDPKERLRLFDQATERIRTRSSSRKRRHPRGRDWKRDDLYNRGRSHWS